MTAANIQVIEIAQTLVYMVENDTPITNEIVDRLIARLDGKKREMGVTAKVLYLMALMTLHNEGVR